MCFNPLRFITNEFKSKSLKMLVNWHGSVRENVGVLLILSSIVLKESIAVFVTALFSHSLDLYIDRRGQKGNLLEARVDALNSHANNCQNQQPYKQRVLDKVL